MKRSISLCILISLAFSVQAQQPPYTIKHFVKEQNPSEFKSSGKVKDGMVKTYIKTWVAYYDVADDNSTHIMGNSELLLCVEGEMKNNEKNGKVSQYLIDSADHSKRYLIAEQIYEKGKLNGRWNVYNLKGTLVKFQTFKNDSLNGLTRNYMIDGITIMDEQEYFNGRSKLIHREFKNGKISSEVTIVNNEPNGEVKEYYASGILKDKFNVKGDKRDGLRIYYYPDGKPWIEQIYKNDKAWTIVSNYDSKGNKRDAGTLKDGNGTVIYYDDDTTVREVVTYKNGEKI